MTGAAYSDSADREQLRRIGRKVRRRLEANTAVRRIVVDKAEIWAVPRFLDVVDCGRLMTLIDATARPSTAFEIDYSQGHRTSYSAYLSASDPFIAGLQDRLDALLGLEPATGERIEGQRYLVGQEFRQHCDWFPAGSPSWAQEKDCGGQRTITAMAYLNLVEEGGETAFPRLDIQVAPRPGTLLIWNNADEDGMPNPWTVHASRPVTRGAKYIFTKWYRCQPWRPSH
jgi:prolyl 4-hydroxylase